MEEKIDKRKGKNKYWYFVTVYTCVLCGNEIEYRERRYDPKPADWWERHKFHQEACDNHF